MRLSRLRFHRVPPHGGKLCAGLALSWRPDELAVVLHSDGGELWTQFARRSRAAETYTSESAERKSSTACDGSAAFQNALSHGAPDGDCDGIAGDGCEALKQDMVAEETTATCNAPEVNGSQETLTGQINCCQNDIKILKRIGNRRQNLFSQQGHETGVMFSGWLGGSTGFRV